MHFTFRAVMLAAGAAATLLPSAAAQAQTAAPAGATVYFINLKDQDTVTSPFKVQFGLTGMGVAPAGVEKDRTGHHHLLIDTDAPADMNAPLPATDKIVHFGKGQTETTLTLPPGKHTLQLLLADLKHVPHEPPVISKKITITVAP